MMVTSYLLGQKMYPIPYVRKKLIAYLVLTTLIFFIHKGMVLLFDNFYFSVGTALLLLAAFAWFVGRVERKEFQQLPVVGKFFRAPVPGTA